MKINCLVVDDEEVSRAIVKRFISKTSFLELADECESAEEAERTLNEKNIDLLFLDVKMPGKSGMDLLRHLETPHKVILISGAEEHAAEAFERSVTDYLVKPFEYPRFLQAVQKARTQIEAIRKETEEQSDLYVKTDARHVRISFHDLLYIEAMADYIIFHTPGQRYIVHYTMKGVEKRLPTSFFARVHRSFIVNCHKIDSLEDLNVMIGNKSIPIGASYKDAFYRRLNFL